MSSGVTGPPRAGDSTSLRAYDRDMEQPHVIVLFGATGDLARRKLLPGLLHLFEAGLLRDCRIVGTSLDDLDTEQFVKFAREGIDEFSRPFDESCWDDFSERLSFVRQSDGPQALADAVAVAEKQLATESDEEIAG